MRKKKNYQKSDIYKFGEVVRNRSWVNVLVKIEDSKDSDFEVLAGILRAFGEQYGFFDVAYEPEDGVFDFLTNLGWSEVKKIERPKD